MLALCLVFLSNSTLFVTSVKPESISWSMQEQFSWVTTLTSHQIWMCSLTGAPKSAVFAKQPAVFVIICSWLGASWLIVRWWIVYIHCWFWKISHMPFLFVVSTTYCSWVSELFRLAPRSHIVSDRHKGRLEPHCWRPEISCGRYSYQQLVCPSEAAFLAADVVDGY